MALSHFTARLIPSRWVVILLLLCAKAARGLFSQEAKHPFIVSVHHPSHYGFLCSGALISTNVILTSASCMEGIDSFAVLTSTLKWTSTHPWNASISNSEQHPLAAFVLRDAVAAPHLRTDICHDSRVLEQTPLMFVSAGDKTDPAKSSFASLDSHPCGKNGPCNATIATDDHPCRTGKGGILVLEDGADTIAVGVVTNATCDFFGKIAEVAYAPIQPSLSALRRLILMNPPSDNPSPSPAILSVSGSTGDIGGKGRLSGPHGIARMGDTLYVADHRSSFIRGVSLAEGDADAAATFLKMNDERPKLRPRGIAVLGNSLYVTGNHVVAMFDVATESGSVVAGRLGHTVGHTNGKLLAARFNFPTGIAISGGLIYVADTGNGAVRVINVKSRTLRGQKGKTVATLRVPEDVSGFSMPQGILAVKSNELLMTDNHAILRVLVDSPVADSVEVLAGAVQEPGNVNGPGASARFHSLAFLALNGTELFVSDKGNAAIRSYDLNSGEVQTAYRGSPTTSNVFADGSEQIWLQDPMGLALSEDNSLLYITDVGMGRIVILPRASLDTEMCGTGLEQHIIWRPNTTMWRGR